MQYFRKLTISAHIYWVQFLFEYVEYIIYVNSTYTFEKSCDLYVIVCKLFTLAIVKVSPPLLYYCNAVLKLLL